MSRVNGFCDQIKVLPKVIKFLYRQIGIMADKLDSPVNMYVDIIKIGTYTRIYKHIFIVLVEPDNWEFIYTIVQNDYVIIYYLSFHKNFRDIGVLNKGIKNIQ